MVCPGNDSIVKMLVKSKPRIPIKRAEKVSKVSLLSEEKCTNPWVDQDKRELRENAIEARKL